MSLRYSSVARSMRTMPLAAWLCCSALCACAESAPPGPLAAKVPGTAALGVVEGSCGDNAVLQVVAHEDDDILFMSPDLLGDVQAGRCIRTLFVTAGDAGLGRDYWASREEGARAAYASMAGVANEWRTSDAGIAGHPIVLQELVGSPNISLAFFRLPDGCDGSGCGTNYGGDSIEILWRDERPISAVDGSSTYTRTELIAVLQQLMSNYQATDLRMQNYVDSLNDGDHADHHTAAYFAFEAQKSLPSSPRVTAYYGYPISNRPENVFGAELTAKRAAFAAYATRDDHVCRPDALCDESNYGLMYDGWVRRQYTVDTTPPSTGSGALHSLGKCLDVRGPSSENGTAAQLWDCVGVANQQWVLNGQGELRGFADKCLDVRGPSSANGTDVQVWDCLGVSNQKWSLSQKGQLVGFAGKCLQVRGGQSQNGVAVELWDCNDSAEQQWTW
ncbi:MAG: hypothetical protein JWN04_1015 [Myxococcaceae bacterium]|nr:hypothetical protein [Myxococcaceae bacterium]